MADGRRGFRLALMASLVAGLALPGWAEDLALQTALPSTLASTTLLLDAARAGDRLIAVGKIDDRDAVLEAVLEREAKMSTGMQNGVAIPHGKTDAVKSLVAAIGLSKAGVDFDSMDGEVCTIFVMTLSPLKRRGPHMQFLAEVSRLIGQPAERERLLACQTHNDIYELFTGK